MKFKVGDKVKLNKNIKDFHYGKAGVSYKEIGIIKNVAKDSYTVSFPSHNSWDGKEEELVLVKYTYEDLEKSPICTKITFENGEVMIKSSANKYENEKRWRTEKDFVRMADKLGTMGEIIKIEEPEYRTVYEYKPEILDEAEKRYLRNFIRPFKDKVTIVKKYFSPTRGKYYIQIRYKEDTPTNFPYYDNDTMYKGMKKDKEYTLEELGL